jgi:hypothetical protein
VATPLEFVVSVSVAPAGDVAKVPLAPEDGAVNVTDTPLAGDPLDVTVACSGAPNACPICALCGVPAAAVIETVGGGGDPPLLLPLQPISTANSVKLSEVRRKWRLFIAALPSLLCFDLQHDLRED